MPSKQNGAQWPPRKVIKPRASHEATTQLRWVAIRNALAKAIRPTYDRDGALNQFAVPFG